MSFNAFVRVASTGKVLIKLAISVERYVYGEAYQCGYRFAISTAMLNRDQESNSMTGPDPHSIVISGYHSGHSFHLSEILTRSTASVGGIGHAHRGSYLNIIRIGNSREDRTRFSRLSIVPLAVKSRLEMISARIGDDPRPLVVAYCR